MPTAKNSRSRKASRRRQASKKIVGLDEALEAMEELDELEAESEIPDDWEEDPDIMDADEDEGDELDDEGLDFDDDDEDFDEALEEDDDDSSDEDDEDDVTAKVAEDILKTARKIHRSSKQREGSGSKLKVAARKILKMSKSSKNPSARKELRALAGRVWHQADNA